MIVFIVPFICLMFYWGYWVYQKSANKEENQSKRKLIVSSMIPSIPVFIITSYVYGTDGTPIQTEWKQFTVYNVVSFLIFMGLIYFLRKIEKGSD